MPSPKAASQNKSTIVNQPFLGLWLTDPPWTIDPRAFVDCNNVIIYTGAVTSENMGWTYTGQQLNGPVRLIADFPTNSNHFLVLGTETDLYDWHNGTPVYITPTYTKGLIDIVGTTVAGTGTKWATQAGTLGNRTNLRAGDQIYIGAADQQNPLAVWHTIASVNSDTSLTLTAPVGTFNAQPYTGRQLLSGGNWEFEVFPGAGPPFNADEIFMVNGVDAPICWNPSDNAATLLSDMPFVAFNVRRFKNLMIYGGLIQNGQLLQTSIANSDNGNPTDMVNGVAGQYVVSDGPYTINHLGVLGNTLMVYMGDMDGGSVVAATFVGFPTNFIFTEVIRGRGPIAPRLVVEFPDRHEFIGADGQYRYNGLFTQLMNTQVWRNVLQNFARSRAEQAFSGIVLQYGIVHFALPLSTDTGDKINQAYVECYLEQPQNPLMKPMTRREFPFTAVGQLPVDTTAEYWNLDPYVWSADPNHWNSNTITGAYAQQYAGDIDGKVYQLFNSNTRPDTDAIVSFATFGHRITINERSRGLVKRVYPFANYQSVGYNLDVTLTLYDQVGGQAWAVDTTEMPLDYSGNRFTSPFRRGRVAQVTFGTSFGSHVWTLQGWDWDVVPGGER